jgi:hypothetical protein
MKSSLLSDLMKKRALNSSKNVKDKIMNLFNFDDLADYEPLEVTLQALRQINISYEVFDKILSMDAGELIEHPQWEEFQQLLQQAILSATDPLIIAKIMLIFMKLIIYFDDHPQGLDVTITYFKCLLQSLTSSSESQTSQQVFILASKADSMIDISLYEYITSIDFYRILFSSMINSLQTIACKKLGQYNAKIIDELLILLFRLLVYGKIEVNHPGNPSVLQNLSIFDVMLYIDSGVIDLFDSLISSYNHYSLLQHASSTGLIYCLHQKISYLLDYHQQILSKHKQLEQDDVHVVAQLVFVMKLLNAFIRAYLLIIRDDVAPELASPAIISPSAGPLHQVDLEIVDQSNKKFYQLKGTRSSILANALAAPLPNPAFASSSSTDIDSFVSRLTQHLTVDTMSVLTLVSSDDRLALAWLTSLSLLLKRSLQDLAQQQSHLIIINEILNAYRSITALRSASETIFLDDRIFALLDNLLIVILENLYLSFEVPIDASYSQRLEQVLGEVSSLVTSNSKLQVYINHSVDEDQPSLLCIDDTIGRCLQLIYRSWRTISYKRPASSASLIALSLQIFETTHLQCDQPTDAIASYLLQQDSDPMEIIAAWSFTKQLSTQAISFVIHFYSYSSMDESSMDESETEIAVDALKIFLDLSYSLIYDILTTKIFLYGRIGCAYSDVESMLRWQLDHQLYDLILAIDKLISKLPRDILREVYDEAITDYDKILIALDHHPHVWELMAAPDSDMLLPWTSISASDDVCELMIHAVFYTMHQANQHASIDVLVEFWQQHWPPLQAYSTADLITVVASSDTRGDELIVLEHEALYPLFYQTLESLSQRQRDSSP